MSQLDTRLAIACVHRLGPGRMFFTSQTLLEVHGYDLDSGEADDFLTGFKEAFDKRWPDGVRVDCNGRIVE